MCYLEILWHICIKGISVFKNEMVFHASWGAIEMCLFSLITCSLTAGHGVAAQWSKSPLRYATKKLFNLRHFHHTETLSESHLLLLEDFVSCQCLMLKACLVFFWLRIISCLSSVLKIFFRFTRRSYSPYLKLKPRVWRFPCGSILKGSQRTS